MPTIYKYPFDIRQTEAGKFSLEMPDDAKVLTIQVQGGVPCIWALTLPSADISERKFIVVGTGHSITYRIDYTKYVGTFQLDEGRFIGHLFEIIK